MKQRVISESRSNLTGEPDTKPEGVTFLSSRYPYFHVVQKWLVCACVQKKKMVWKIIAEQVFAQNLGRFLCVSCYVIKIQVRIFSNLCVHVFYRTTLVFFCVDVRS